MAKSFLMTIPSVDKDLSHQNFHMLLVVTRMLQPQWESLVVPFKVKYTAPILPRNATLRNISKKDES